MVSKCQKFSLPVFQTDKTGCFSASVDLAFFNLLSPRYSHSINVVATLVEAGTGKPWDLQSTVCVCERAREGADCFSQRVAEEGDADAG